MKQEYVGVVNSDPYGFRTDVGYESFLYLRTDNSQIIPLGNGAYSNIFEDKIGRKIRLVIEDVEDIEEAET